MSTLERLSPEDLESEDEFLRESVRLHIERYTFASEYVRGQRVLDIACGVGYGSALLAEAGARSVVGMDIDETAITSAYATYGRTGVEFVTAGYDALRDGAPAVPVGARPPFDVAVSLETIEHIPDSDRFLSALTQCLSPGGMLVASVPVTPSMDANPYHVHDFTPRSFRRLLVRHGFQEIASLRQRQSFNPFLVRAQLRRSNRAEFRTNLPAYYVRNPSGALKRIASSLRHGFVNLVDVVAAELR